MRPTPASLRVSCALLSMLFLAACGDWTAREGDAAPPADTEPAAPALEGLSPEQIEQRARAMSPEQAEELGVVDTTVQVTDEP